MKIANIIFPKYVAPGRMFEAVLGLFSGFRPGGLEMVARSHKRGQDPAKTAQDISRLQDGFEMAPRRTKTVQDGTKKAQDGPKKDSGWLRGGPGPRGR